MKILNFGSMNLDYVYTVDHLASAGETLASADLSVYCGGKGLNQTIALARAGAAVYHAGCVGEDGAALLETCRSSGADTRFIRRIQGRSGHTIIQVDKNGQNCILLYGGSNRAQNRDHISEVLSNFAAGDMLLLQNEINELPFLIDAAYERGMRIILNPSPYDEELKRCKLDKVSVFLMNELEAVRMTGNTAGNFLIQNTAKLFPKAEIVLTLGERGSCYLHQGEILTQDIFPVRAIDTTGAGDTYTGYFLAARMRGLPIRASLAAAAKASAIAVTRKGAAPSIPYWREVMETPD